MEMHDFNKQIDRLDSIWSKFYSDERRATLWRALQNRTEWALQKVVDNFCANERLAPTPAMIIQEAYKFSLPDGRASSCKLCDDSAWILAENDNFAARCPCHGGPDALLKTLESKSGGKAHKELIDSVRKDITDGTYAKIIEQRRIQVLIEVNKLS